MRGTIIFALTTLVVPTLTAAVPLVDTTSFNVEPDVKRHVQVLNTEQSRRTTDPERLPIIQVIKRGGLTKWSGESNVADIAKRGKDLVERGRGTQSGGSGKRDAEGLVERGGVAHGGHRGGGAKRDAKPIEDLVERGRGAQRGGGGRRRSEEKTVELVERGRGAQRGGDKRDAEPIEGLVERGRGAGRGGSG